MTWTSKEIKELRQRCGWSVAEMARQLGCRAETVKDLEGGSQAPDSEICHVMEHIRNCAEANAETTRRQARADIRMQGAGLDQIHRDDLDLKM
jgi:ribosome-binding protein aMBF1 (putative translation factor)